MNTPQELKYSDSDEWVKQEADLVTVGITDFAQHELGDVVYVELPEPGTPITAGSPFGVVESVKAVSDLISPVTGTVQQSNSAAIEDPALINNSPYEQGWLIKVSGVTLGDSLLDAATYESTRHAH